MTERAGSGTQGGTTELAGGIRLIQTMVNNSVRSAMRSAVGEITDAVCGKLEQQLNEPPAAGRAPIAIAVAESPATDRLAVAIATAESATAAITYGLPKVL